MNVFVESWRTQFQRNLDRSNIARIRQNFRHSKLAIFLVIVNPVPGNDNRAVLAVENFLGANQILVERCGQRHQLERRTRFVNRADCPVHARFRRHRRSRIRVVLRPIRQRQDRTRVGVLHNHAAGGRVNFLDNRCQFALRDVLNLFVQRQHHAFARVLPRFAAVKFLLARVGHHHNSFALAANQVVVLVFDSAQPMLVHVHKSQDVRRHVQLRVIPLVLFLKINSLQVQ